MVNQIDKSELLMQVLDRYDVKYKPAYNGWQSISCPNKASHPRGDRTPSCRVNLQYGGIMCMACGMKGDGYSALMVIEGIEFKVALDQLGKVIKTSGTGFVI